ncbi:MAG: phosphate ABC transporter permease PstA [Lachnospiraceae bacterium]|nr:phosphate ABC transporter permease PstA [uncultured Acetatifactor sp.]MCI8543980.1 phosphate ABC transporter permease PstA [Lachnospiraceae bacterium]
MTQKTLYQKRRKPAELFLWAAVYGAAYFSVFLLLGIIGYIFFRGFRVLSLRFLTSVTSLWRGTVGIAGSLLNTLYVIVLSLVVAVPVGTGAAIYLSEYAKPGRLIRLIEFATEILAGIPSVIFGLFGMVFFGNVLGMGYSLLNGSLTLALMVLPLIVRNTQRALDTVPEGYRCGALGLGAPKWHLIRTILLPTAMPGILTGIILAVGRIVGESAALLFTAGSARLLPGFGGSLGRDLSLLYEKIFQPGGTLAVELYLQMQNGEYETAFGIGCVLVLMALLMNFLVKLVCAGRTDDCQRD